MMANTRLYLKDSEIVRLYTELGWSTTKIARHFWCSAGAVHERLVAAKVDRRPQHQDRVAMMRSAKKRLEAKKV